MRRSRWTIDGVGTIFGSILQHLIHGFPLSGPESGHTERRAAYNAALATVLFHPDYDRRLRNHTESADPFSLCESFRTPGGRRRSRAWASSPLPPVGIFAPP